MTTRLPPPREAHMMSVSAKSASSKTLLSDLSQSFKYQRASMSSRSLGANHHHHNDHHPTKKPATGLGSKLVAWLPRNRRSSLKVQKVSTQVADFSQLLCRDSAFLGSADDAETMTMTTTSSEFGSESSFAVAQVHRDELTVGHVLGQGQFSKCVEIVRMDLPDDEEDDDDEKDNARAVLARDAAQGKLVMKRLKKRLLWNGSSKDFLAAAANLMVEARFLTKLSEHPNINRIRGVAMGGASAWSEGNHDGYFLVLDRLSETMDERIHSGWAILREQGLLPSESDLVYQKAHYALQLASALQFLHDRRIIFRDCKPNNIGFLPHSEHTVQLFDFGLAREMPPAMGLGANELFCMTSTAGSRLYCAPEVVNQGMYNSKCDTYSWAMTLYELLAEQRPFSGEQKKDFGKMVYTDQQRPNFENCPAPVPPPSLLELLENSWNDDVFARYTMEEVFQRLEQILQELKPN